tara:strand:- start:824 stop:1006 length:183 start_codon:yes stop_codon:yes gene_type:complete
MKKQNINKQKTWESDEPKIRRDRNMKKVKRHSCKENLKDILKGNLDYDEYMEMEDWSDSR